MYANQLWLRPMTPAEFQKITHVSRETMAKLAAYEALIFRWQKKINLVSRASLDQIWQRHFLDCWQMIHHIRPTDHRLADLGSGNGMPGIIFALCTDLEVILIESDRRKAVFLNEAVRVLGLQVKIAPRRIENLPPLGVDIITARALAPLNQLLDYAHTHINKNGICIFAKGRQLQTEIKNAKKQWRLTSESFNSKTDPDGILVVREFFTCWNALLSIITSNAA